MLAVAFDFVVFSVMNEVTCEIKNFCFRFYVLHHIPGLKFLDSRHVSPEEHQEAQQRGRFMKVVRPENSAVCM